jgi:membrane protein
MTEFGEDDIPNQAAKVAYYFFLSLPPLVMALFATAGIFGGEDTANWLATRLGGMLPAEAGALVGGFVDEVVRESHPGPLSVGLLLALWAASNVFMALEDTLNAVYHIREKRGFVQRRLVVLGTLVAVGVLFVAGSAVLLAGPALSRAMGLGAVGDTLWDLGQWPLSFALIVGAFWVIYYVLPLRDQRGCKGVLLRSSAIAAVLWLLATLAFRVYIANFGSYSATYGLLGTVIVLLLWMYVTSLVILLGGEISAEMER